jgi:magnesium-transporting ATPase (P-type)
MIPAAILLYECGADFPHRLDDNFASIVRALAWGRMVNDASKKFLQVR